MRGDVEELPRLQYIVSHKSNRMLILRDYIISAASQINAGAGGNGFNPTNYGLSDFSLLGTTLDTNNKQSVVLKPSLIDMEARWGDMAQAKAA